jgi:hypothetical protein
MARPGEEGKLDASGTSHSGKANVAEICNQVLMMLSHEIFDPEFGKGGPDRSSLHRRWRGDHQAGTQLGPATH